MGESFDIQKFIKKHNDNLSYKELEYCKDTGKTYSHIQTYNFDGKIYQIEHTHKIVIANRSEIRSFESLMTLID